MLFLLSNYMFVNFSTMHEDESFHRVPFITSMNKLSSHYVNKI